MSQLTHRSNWSAARPAWFAPASTAASTGTGEPRRNAPNWPILLLFLVLAGLFLAPRLWHLTAYCLDGDEIFSVQAARQDWAGLMATVVHDVSHPPLFYALLKVWMTANDQSLWWLRLYPALTSFASLLPFFFLCRELRLHRGETLLAAAMMVGNAYLIGYAQHLRMFALLQFFSLWALWLFVRFTQSNPEQQRTAGAGLFLANLLMVYSHYWGWVVVGTELLFLAGWQRRQFRSFCLWLALLLLCFCPWALAVATAGVRKGSLISQVSWIPRPAPSDLVYFYGCLNGTFPWRHSTLIGQFLLAGPALLWAWRAFANRGKPLEDRQCLFWFLSLFAFVPVLATFVASLVFKQSVWAERQLIIVAVPYGMLLAVGTSQLRQRAARVGMAVLMLAWTVGAGALALPEGARKLAWDSLVAEMARAERSSGGKVDVFTSESFVATPIRFFLESAAETRFRVKVIDNPNLVDRDHFWFAYRDTTWKGQRSPAETLAEQGYRVGACVQVATRSQTVFLFPVWRRQP